MPAPRDCALEPTESGAPELRPDPEVDRWRAVGRWGAYCAAGAFLTQAVLFLLDRTGALAPRVAFHESGRGLEPDLIAYYVGDSERMHSIWWSVAARDLAGPIGYLALVVAVQSVVLVTPSTRPRQEIGRLFVVLGSAAAALSDVMYLAHVTWWRPGPLRPTPDVISHGRALEVADAIGRSIQAGGYLVLAVGLLCLAPTVGGGPWRRRLAWSARLEAGALGMLVLATAAGADTMALGTAAASGLLLAPLLALCLARALGPASPTRDADPRLAGAGR